MGKYVYEIRAYSHHVQKHYHLAMDLAHKQEVVQPLMSDKTLDKIKVREVEQNTDFCHTVTTYRKIKGVWHMKNKYIGEDDEERKES